MSRPRVACSNGMGDRLNGRIVSQKVSCRPGGSYR
jgi:hypothetical protein